MLLLLNPKIRSFPPVPSTMHPLVFFRAGRTTSHDPIEDTAAFPPPICQKWVTNLNDIRFRWRRSMSVMNLQWRSWVIVANYEWYVWLAIGAHLSCSFSREKRDERMRIFLTSSHLDHSFSELTSSQEGSKSVPSHTRSLFIPTNDDPHT